MEILRGPELREEGALAIMRKIGGRAIGVLVVLSAALSVGGCVEELVGDVASDAVDYPVRGEKPVDDKIPVSDEPPVDAKIPEQIKASSYVFGAPDSGGVKVPKLPWIPPPPEPYLSLELAIGVTELTDL